MRPGANRDPDTVYITRWYAYQSDAHKGVQLLAQVGSDQIVFRTIRENDISTILAQNETECPQ
jgi:hypothetical protein